jgi:hypothetical protein
MVYDEECDLPRIEEQLRELALQFNTVNYVEIFINGESLEKPLDLRGQETNSFS